MNLIKILILNFSLIISTSGFSLEKEKAIDLSRAKSKKIQNFANRDLNKFFPFYFSIVNKPKHLKALTKNMEKKNSKFLQAIHALPDHLKFPELEIKGNIFTFTTGNKKVDLDISQYKVGKVKVNGKDYIVSGDVDELYNTVLADLLPKQSLISKLILDEAHALVPLVVLGVKLLASLISAVSAYAVCKARECKSPILGALLGPFYLAYAAVDHLMDFDGKSLGEILKESLGVERILCPQENFGKLEMVIRDTNTGAKRSYAINFSKKSELEVDWGKPYSFEIVEKGENLIRNVFSQAEEWTLEKDENYEARSKIVSAMRSVSEFVCNEDPDLAGAANTILDELDGAIKLDSKDDSSGSRTSN